MKLPRFFSAPARGARNEALGGGTTFVALNTDFAAKGYKKAKGSYDPFRAGRQAARKAAPDVPIVESPELHITGIVEANRDQLEAKARSVLMHAKAELELGGDDLNEAAIKDQVRTQIQSALYAALQQAQSLIREANNAQGNLTEFEIREQQNTLTQGSYAPGGTASLQLAKTALFLPPDIAVNTLSYAPAMQGGLVQALATSVSASLSMVLFGILVGTGLRFFNYRSDASRRTMWRTITLASGLGALFVAFAFEQYRAVLEVAATEGREASEYSIFGVSPSIAGLPVLIGCVIVFSVAVLKFRGGRGTPWAEYGDHAAFDRAYHEAQDELEGLKEDFVLHTDEIYADSVNALSEAIDAERDALKKGKAQCANAKLTLSDLKNSQQKFVRAALPDFGLLRAGMIADRPDLDPEDFSPVTLRGLEGFPDAADLDEAVAAAEAALARRTEQIAGIETAIGEMVTRAREEFFRVLAKAVRRDETRRNPIQAVKFEIKGGKL